MDEFHTKITFPNAINRNIVCHLHLARTFILVLASQDTKLRRLYKNLDFMLLRMSMQQVAGTGMISGHRYSLV